MVVIIVNQYNTLIKACDFQYEPTPPFENISDITVELLLKNRYFRTVNRDTIRFIVKNMKTEEKDKLLGVYEEDKVNGLYELLHYQDSIKE